MYRLVGYSSSQNGLRIRYRNAVWLFELKRTLVVDDPQYMTMFALLPPRQCSHVEIDVFPCNCQYYDPGVAGVLDLMVARGPMEDLSGLLGKQTSSETCIF